MDSQAMERTEKVRLSRQLLESEGWGYISEEIKRQVRGTGEQIDSSSVATISDRKVSVDPDRVEGIPKRDALGLAPVGGVGEFAVVALPRFPDERAPRRSMAAQAGELRAQDHSVRAAFVRARKPRQGKVAI